MTIELINTGAELLLGRTLNTHQQWLCRQLSDLGWTVTRQMAVPDEAAPICAAVREALGRADVVITTGGLGPTSDDLTRETIAQLFEVSLQEDKTVLDCIEAIFRERGRVMPERARVQALVPEGARVLPNRFGTAPGLMLELDPNLFRSGSIPGYLIMLPGPPRELRPMFQDSVVPQLRGLRFQSKPFRCVTLRTTGLAESLAQERIELPLAPLVRQGLDLAYCARLGEVDVRLSARGEEAEAIVGAATEIVRDRLGAWYYTDSDESLESIVVHLLRAQHRTVVVAESCTGGLIAHRLTNVPGASEVFLAGLTTYSNEAKHQLLGVAQDLLVQHGSVSEPVVRVMAEGARLVTGADLAVAVTGIAGPGGGTKDKPLGTVHFALATEHQTIAVGRCNRFDREGFKQVTSQQALELVRRSLLNLPVP